MDGKGRRLFPFRMASRQVRTARECIFNIIRSPWGPSKDEPVGPPTDTVDVSETVDATQTEVAGWCCWDRWEVKKSFFWREDFQRVPFLTWIYGKHDIFSRGFRSQVPLYVHNFSAHVVNLGLDIVDFLCTFHDGNFLKAHFTYVKKEETYFVTSMGPPSQGS